MASTRKMLTKDGRVYYEINVSRGRGKSRLTRRWYAPDGWSRKAIERELAAVAAEFERQCDTGEVVSRAEQRERAAQEAAEAAKILRAYPKIIRTHIACIFYAILRCFFLPGDSPPAKKRLVWRKI